MAAKTMHAVDAGIDGIIHPRTPRQPTSDDPCKIVSLRSRISPGSSSIPRRYVTLLIFTGISFFSNLSLTTKLGGATLGASGGAPC